MTSLRKSTMELMGLGSPLNIFDKTRLPAQLNDLVDDVFGPAPHRGALVITGGSGIVGSGKAMQLGARLMEFGVPLVALDIAGAPDGLGGQFAGLKRTFGEAQAAAIMADVVRMHYDGARLPSALGRFTPRFVLEAIPEILSIKRAHYALWRADYPQAEIRSVTSGFPSTELGVGILHPSFPHPINKVWEVVEAKPSKITQLLWALGLIPLPVGDYWSFILDVLFCGVTLSALRFHRATNMPYWKLDKFVRRLLGPNPVRAHDAIGPGASFLTWSCLHHLAGQYGALFEPDVELVRRKSSGESWYLSSRPVVDWTLDDEDPFRQWLMGPILQMTSLLIHEKRATLPVMNAIGELCAQFSRGTPAMARRLGSGQVLKVVEGYHRRHPAAAAGAWFPEVFARMEEPEWRQLYVNAEHNGLFGVITLSREAINSDVIAELNRAVDWLKQEGIERVVVSGDFHLSMQLVGADIAEFFPALDDETEGFRIARDWSLAARRLYDEFRVSVGFIHGKRCLGGMLELMAHCRYQVAVDSCQLGMPEVTLPVVPGMEGCHWLLRRCGLEDRGRVIRMLLDGRPRRAAEGVGWLVDFAGTLDDALKMANGLLTGNGGGLRFRCPEEGQVTLPEPLPNAAITAGVASAAGRQAILDCVRHACRVMLSEALEVQARHSAGFMVSEACRRGEVGRNRKRLWEV